MTRARPAGAPSHVCGSPSLRPASSGSLGRVARAHMPPATSPRRAHALEVLCGGVDAVGRPLSASPRRKEARVAPPLRSALTDPSRSPLSSYSPLPSTMPRRVRVTASGLAAAAVAALLASTASAQRTTAVGDPVRASTPGLPAPVVAAPVPAASPVIAPSAPVAAPSAPALSSYSPNKAVLSGTGPVYKKSEKLEPVRNWGREREKRERGGRGLLFPHPLLLHHRPLSSLPPFLSPSPPLSSTRTCTASPSRRDTTTRTSS